MGKKPKQIPIESELSSVITEGLKVIRTAKRNKKSVANGGNFYAIKFSELRTRSIIALRNLEQHFLDNAESNAIMVSISASVKLFFETSTSDSERSGVGKKILSDFRTLIIPALKHTPAHSPTDRLFPFELVKEDNREYIKKIAVQASGCYDHGWYDASAVMIRRLLETLIIECFEKHSITHKIKDQSNNFFYLRDLISKFLHDNDGKWNVSRNTKDALPNLKDIGDKSAHNRYFTARQSDIASIKKDLRTVIEELINISKPMN